MSLEQSTAGKPIPVNSPFIDSFSLKIPLDKVVVLDHRLTSATAIYYESLDAVDEELQPPKPIVLTWSGMTVRFSLVEIPIFNQKTREKELTKFVNLTVSAKLLKERYFEGVNAFNISTLHQTFIDFKVFHCTLETFLSGMVSDIDIAINRYCPSPAIFSDILGCLFTQSGSKSKYLKLFREDTNIGLNFNERHFAKPSLPFIKFYHKELELLHKSTEFNETFLGDYQEQIRNLTRVEATIRNYDHKRRLEKHNILPNFKTLKELLEVPGKDLYKFVVFCLDTYLEKKVRLKAPELSPTDHIIYELLQNCVLRGYDYDSLLSVVDTFKGATKESAKVSKSRMRKKITQLFDLLVMKDVKIQSQINHNSHVLEYLKFFGIKI